jgi:hypothetical protein
LDKPRAADVYPYHNTSLCFIVIIVLCKTSSLGVKGKFMVKEDEADDGV